VSLVRSVGIARHVGNAGTPAFILALCSTAQPRMILMFELECCATGVLDRSLAPTAFRVAALSCCAPSRVPCLDHPASIACRSSSRDEREQRNFASTKFEGSAFFDVPEYDGRSNEEATYVLPCCRQRIPLAKWDIGGDLPGSQLHFVCNRSPIDGVHCGTV
jgi:hypothetical protein